jgi:hypothetical protein
MSDDLESLLAYCRDLRRVCPMPDRWNELWEMLPDRERTSGGGWQPSLPLILGGSDAPDCMKSERLVEHLAWAHTHGVLPQVNAFLRALPERAWHHKRAGQEL